MVDDFGNKTLEEQVTEREVIDHSMAIVEDLYQAIVWSKNPESAKTHSEINKDLALANLTKRELKQVRMYIEIAAECKEMGFLKDAKFFLLKAYVMCVSSLSLDGFGQKGINRTGKDVEIHSSSSTKPPAPNPQKKGWNPFATE